MVVELTAFSVSANIDFCLRFGDFTVSLNEIDHRREQQKNCQPVLEKRTNLPIIFLSKLELLFKRKLRNTFDGSF